MCNKSKNKQTQQQTFNQTTTTTPTLPSNISSGFDQFQQGVSGLMNSNQPFVSGPSSLQQLAFSQAPGMLGMGQSGQSGKDPYAPEVNGGPGDGYTPNSSAGSFDLARSLGMSAGTAGANMAGPAATYEAAGAGARTFSQADLQPILNTYLGGVVDTSLADYDAGVGQAQSQLSRQAAMNGGGRNSNNAIAQGVLGGEAARGRASTAANLRYDAYDRASQILGQDSDRLANVGMFNAGQANQAGQFNAGSQNQQSMFNAGQQDIAQNRQLSAASLFGNLGTAQGNENRANLGLLSDLGNQQRNIDNAQGQGEFARYAALQQLLGYDPRLQIGQTATGSGTTNTTGTSTQSGNLLGSLGAGLMGLGGLGWQPFGSN